MKYFLLLVVSVSFQSALFGAALAQAAPGWSVPVNALEASFGCQGQGQEATPDLTVSPAVNAPAGQHGEVRVGGEDSLFVLQGNDVLLRTGADSQDIFKVGTLASQPSCDVEDAGEPAQPSWVGINLASNLSAVLSFTGDASSCTPQSPDIGNVGGYLRTNYYSLAFTDSSTGAVQTATWQEQGYYGTLAECQSAQD